MGGNVVGLPNVATDVGDVSKIVDARAGCELLHLLDAVSACDTDDLNLTRKLFLYRCDRRGFSPARRSPGGPEPQHGVLAGQVVGVEQGAVDVVGNEGVRPRRVVGVSRWRGVVLGCCSCGIIVG